jgi:hypothetical protein
MDPQKIIIPAVIGLVVWGILQSTQKRATKSLNPDRLETVFSDLRQGKETAVRFARGHTYIAVVFFAVVTCGALAIAFIKNEPSFLLLAVVAALMTIWGVRSLGDVFDIIITNEGLTGHSSYVPMSKRRAFIAWNDISKLRPDGLRNMVIEGSKERFIWVSKSHIGSSIIYDMLRAKRPDIYSLSGGKGPSDAKRY